MAKSRQDTSTKGAMYRLRSLRLSTKMRLGFAWILIPIDGALSDGSAVLLYIVTGVQTCVYILYIRSRMVGQKARIQWKWKNDV